MKNNKISFIQFFPILSYIAIFLIVVITLILLFDRSRGKDNEQVNSKENFYSEDPIVMENSVENFIRYAGLQMFCPSMYKNLATFWAKLPESKGEGLYIKICCDSCYSTISKEICKDGGKYELALLENEDLEKLTHYYNKNNFTFGLDQDTINENIGNIVLKMSIENISYPVQILKFKEDIPEEENINEELYEDC